MRKRAFLSGDWLATGRAGAGLQPRRTLCGRRGRGCRCQLVRVSRPEVSSRSLPLPAPQTAGEGRRGSRRAWPRATEVAASVLTRAWRAGRDVRGPAHGDPGRASYGLGVRWAAEAWLPAEPLRSLFFSFSRCWAQRFLCGGPPAVRGADLLPPSPRGS